MFTRKRHLIPITAAAILAITLASCGKAAAPGAGGTPAGSPSPTATGRTATPTPAATSSSATPPATSRASAAGQLAAFFAAAQTADIQLKHAAVLVNQGIGKTSMSFSPAALAAVKALSTTEVAHAIPAGLPPELLRRVMLVYSDLESRRMSLDRVWEAQFYPSPLPISSPSPGTLTEGSYMYGCLGNGAPAAARYPADLAALCDLAEATAPVTLAAPDSRTVAELALRISLINGANSGCDECGGYFATTLARIVWQPKGSGIGHSDGTIDGIGFTAVYRPGHGWDVTLFAC
jgi:hypothetical protein